MNEEQMISNILQEVLGLDDTDQTASWTHVTKNVMVVLSTMSNPIIYFISDSKFRKDLVLLFTGKPCRRIHKHQVHPLSTAVNTNNTSMYRSTVPSNLSEQFSIQCVA